VLNSPTTALAVAVLLMAVGVFFLWRSTIREQYRVVLTAGNLSERSALLAEKFIVPAARGNNLTLTLVNSAGSEQSLDLVNDGTAVQAALTEGGLGAEGRPDVREVVPLHTTVLHLLLKPETYRVAIHDSLPTALRGQRISTGVPGSGTYTFSTRILNFLGLEQGDYIQDSLTDTPAIEIAKRTQDLPDALFIISLLPSPEVQRLVRDFGYRLYPLPDAEALQLADPSISSAVIPEHLYSYDPPVPDQPLTTLARRVLLVANKDVPPKAVAALLRATLDSGYARAYHPFLSTDQFLLDSEYPRHPGSDLYLHGDALVTQDTIDRVRSLGPALGTLLPGFLLLRRSFRRWHRRGQIHSLRQYLVEVTVLERTARSQEESPTANLAELLRIRRRLSELKSEALEDYAKGNLLHEELMGSFLQHVSDLRSYVNALLAGEHGEHQQRNQDPSLLDELEDLVARPQGKTSRA
jgi:TRAP-type uncharacterized transport system substrate-binding protein